MPSAVKPFRCSFGGDIVRGDADDGDNEFGFCGKIVAVVSELLNVVSGECISLGRIVFDPGDICDESLLFESITTVNRGDLSKSTFAYTLLKSASLLSLKFELLLLLLLLVWPAQFSFA